MYLNPAHQSVKSCVRYLCRASARLQISSLSSALMLNCLKCIIYEDCYRKGTGMSHLLEVKNLTTAFTGDYGRNVSVDHVSFHVDEGEVVCIVGESGCGKSVTSLSIMGLLGRGGAVTDGSVLFDGKRAAYDVGKGAGSDPWKSR